MNYIDDCLANIKKGIFDDRTHATFQYLYDYGKIDVERLKSTKNDRFIKAVEYVKLIIGTNPNYKPHDKMIILQAIDHNAKLLLEGKPFNQFALTEVIHYSKYLFLYENYK